MKKDSKSTFHKRDVKSFIRKLKRQEIDFFDIPEEFRLHTDIVNVERKLGIRKSYKRGFDVIRNIFFVEELVLCKEFEEEELESYISVFQDFPSYYEFLEGDIYENSCYYQYNFSQAEIESYGIDINKINNTAFIDITTKDFSIELSEEELQHYEEVEKDKALRKKWILKFNSCNNYADFQKIVSEFKESKFSRKDYIFFFYNFIFADKDKAFDILMKYLSDGAFPARLLEKGLCSIYEPQKVLSASTLNGSKKKLKEYIKRLENGEVQFYYCSYFDEETHFFCQKVTGYLDEFPTVEIYRYFETFQELVEYLDNDLSDCDLSKAILPDVDFSVYETNKHTKLPIQNPNDLTYYLYKGYDRKSNCFVVKQCWLDENGQTIKKYDHKFKYFFDFVFFLERDLSDADLLFCDGLNNIDDFSNLDLTNARLRSTILDRIGTIYELSNIDAKSAETFPTVIKNEEETALNLEYKRDCIEENIKEQKVYYVSDLHLLHKIKNAGCKSLDDVLYTIQRNIDNLLDEVKFWEKNFILIGGDTSSDFNIFCFFIRLLRQSIDQRNLDVKVIFLLGNHELWDFPEYSFEKIVQKYEGAINKYEMYLLQNNIIYKDDENIIKKITTDELLYSSKETLRARLKCARIILFGGLAFSGYNETFNANNNIYRCTIDRNQEVIESKEFEHLYNIVCDTLYERNVIVFTHTPQNDWCSYSKPKSGFIYVSGHTHRNYFYDDGQYRVYADNQVGYNQKTSSLKYFYLEDEYDWFSEYNDGIYEITKEQYVNFYRGKKMQMTFNRDVNVLYMLKKNGYYCFIHQSKNKQLTILNGGAFKKLDIKDINYYYNGMDVAIAHIKAPLDKFVSIQKEIANEIKTIGGSGNVHGAIIDIDFYSHIYVNPYDLTVTAYWASDTINKKVYSSIPKLLKSKCPLLYANYVNLLNGNSEMHLAISDNKKKLDIFPHTYLDTDIYRVSREIKKMQRLSSNILSTWYEPTKKMLE